jgi:hypothetical protein
MEHSQCPLRNRFHRPNVASIYQLSPRSTSPTYSGATTGTSRRTRRRPAPSTGRHSVGCWPSTESEPDADSGGQTADDTTASQKSESEAGEAPQHGPARGEGQGVETNSGADATHQSTRRGVHGEAERGARGVARRGRRTAGCERHCRGSGAWAPAGADGPASGGAALLECAERLRDDILRSKLTHPDPWTYTAKARTWGGGIQALVEEIAVAGQTPGLHARFATLLAEVEGDPDFQRARQVF